MSIQYAHFTLHLEVTDSEELRKHAEQVALREGMTLEDWHRTRSGIEDDIRMVFDPGMSPPGTSIEDSTVDMRWLG